MAFGAIALTVHADLGMSPNAGYATNGKDELACGFKHPEDESPLQPSRRAA
jgi:hypothetical protein